jgi:polysaccharide pyruvyl transferase CsaB
MIKKNKKTIMISGYYGFGNAGDEAILAAMIQQMREHLDDPRIIVLSESPEETAKEYGVESFQRKNYPGIFRLMGEIDVFVSGGGGLVQDATGFNTVVYYLSLVQLAKLRGKKVMLYAQGLGPLHLKKSRDVARFIMNQADMITFRDEKSKLLSESIGIKKPPVHVTADPVFALRPPEPSILDPIAKEEEIFPDRFNLGISVRPWDSGIDYLMLIASLADSYALENNANIFIFPFQETQDLEVCEKLKAKIQSPCRIIPRKYPIPVLEGLLGRMNLTIGMRLHSLIFSTVMGVPSVGVSYDPKVSVLMGIMGLPWVDVTKFSKKELFDASSGIYLKQGSIKERLLKKSEELKELADNNIEFLKELLK